MSIPAKNEQLDSFLNKGQVVNDPAADFKVIVCIDMDAFYAASEAIRFGYDDTVPVVVAQWSGTIAVSYAARKYGVGRFMRIDEIRKVCPQVVFIHVDTIKLGQPYTDPYKRDLKEKLVLGRDRDKEKVSLDYYRFESDKVLSIFRKHCSVVEKASIDESFFDLTDEVTEIYNSGNYPRTWEGKIAGGESFEPQTKEDILLMIGAQLTDKIRKEVTGTLKYTCSAGVSYNKMLAKLASGLNKPNAQTVVLNRYVEDALKPVEISKLRNFGGKIAEAFKTAGYTTLGQIQSLSLEEIIPIVRDEHCARWVYFRSRGHDDEVVEEKDFTNKSLLSNKSFDRAVTNMLDLENVVDLVLSDLNSRMVRFYREGGLVPSTLNLQYWDNKTHERRTKSGPIHLKIKEDKFYDALKVKTQELAKQVANVLFPCKFLGVSVKGFVKNDMKSYGFDLLTYAKQKQQQKANETAALLELERQKENEKEFNELMGHEMEHLKEKLDKSVDISHIEGVGDESVTQQNFEDLARKDSFEICSGNLIAEKEFMLQQQQQNQEEIPQQALQRIEEEEEEVKMVEQVECEKCGKMIPKPELTDHYDFHIAQDLDKEINPNKRKYRKADNGQILANFGGGKEVPQEQVFKVIESKSVENSKSKPLEALPRHGKKVNEANNKKKVVTTMKSLDNFFQKK